MTCRRLPLILLSVFVIGLGCASKKPAILEEDSTREREGGMETETIEGEVPVTPSFDESATEGTDLGQPGEDSGLRAVYFDFDRYDLRPDARATLKENARKLKQDPEVKLTLEGHCDERGTKEYNLALGDRRANSVYRYLVDLGVEARRLNTISYGEEYPADPEHTEQAWSRNRRVEFTIVK